MYIEDNNTTNESELSRRGEMLLDKVYPTLDNYSNSEKFKLVPKIFDTITEMLKYIELSNSVSSKKIVYLQEADGYLRMFKILHKLADKRKEISHNFWSEVDLQVTEIRQLIKTEIRKR